MSALFDEDHPIKRLQRAESLFLSGRFSDAARQFRPLRRHPLTADNALRRLAYIALLAGESKAAESRLRQLPPEGESLKLSAALYRRTGQLAAAARCLRELGNDTMAHAMHRLAATPLTISSPARVRCPFVTLNPLPLLPVTVEGEPCLFLLDTGSQEMVLDAELAGQLGLWQSAPQTALQAGGNGALRYGLLNTFELGGARFRDLPIQIQPLAPTFDRLFDIRVEGIIGISLLSHFFVQADFGRGELILQPPATAPGRGPRFWLADAFLPIVRTVIDRRTTVPMLLDTGQQGFAAAVSHSIAESAALPLAGLPVAGEGGGGSVRVLPTRIERLTVAGTSFERPPSVCLPQFGLEHRFGFRIGGLLGYEAVRGRRLSLDFRRMRLGLS